LTPWEPETASMPDLFHSTFRAPMWRTVWLTGTLPEHSPLPGREGPRRSGTDSIGSNFFVRTASSRRAHRGVKLSVGFGWHACLRNSLNTRSALRPCFSTCVPFSPFFSFNRRSVCDRSHSRTKGRLKCWRSGLLKTQGVYQVSST
jgi:hypothetical protein